MIFCDIKEFNNKGILYHAKLVKGHTEAYTRPLFSGYGYIYGYMAIYGNNENIKENVKKVLHCYAKRAILRVGKK